MHSFGVLHIFAVFAVAIFFISCCRVLYSLSGDICTNTNFGSRPEAAQGPVELQNAITNVNTNKDTSTNTNIDY